MCSHSSSYSSLYISGAMKWSMLMPLCTVRWWRSTAARKKGADLDLAMVAIDEDVVALEVVVDHRRVVGVEVGEAAQDLARPIGEAPAAAAVSPRPWARGR